MGLPAARGDAGLAALAEFVERAKASGLRRRRAGAPSHRRRARRAGGATLTAPVRTHGGVGSAGIRRCSGAIGIARKSRSPSLALKLRCDAPIWAIGLAPPSLPRRVSRLAVFPVVPLQDFHPAVAAGSAARSAPTEAQAARLAGDPRRPAHAGRRADRLGQDAGGVPRRASTTWCATALAPGGARRRDAVVYVSPLKALVERHPEATSRRRSPASAPSCARSASPTSRSAPRCAPATRRPASGADAASGRRTSW